jgi:Carboxypeptidase regulatory-like domain
MRPAFRPLPLLLLYAAALLAAAPVTARAQAVYGRVADAADGGPVAAAFVVALDGAGAAVASTVSGTDGRYDLALPAAGSFRLQVSRVGYRTGISPPVAVGPGDRMGLDLSLRSAAIALDQVQARVTPPFRDVRARQFYARMDRRRGRYLSPERVQQLGLTRTSDLLRTIPGVSFSSGLGSGGLRLGGRLRGCTPILYIDGYRFHPYPGWRLDDHVGVEEVWAIEVYMDGADIPAELPRDGMGRCGIVMIWTHGS